MLYHKQFAACLWTAAFLFSVTLTSFFLAPATASAEQGPSGQPSEARPDDAATLDAPAPGEDAPAVASTSEGDPGIANPAVPAGDGAAQPPFPLSAKNLSPMMQAIRAAWEEFEVTRTSLQEAVDAAPNAAAALEAQRRLEASASEFELRVLRIQAEFARREGRTDQAERIEAAIRAIESPPDLRAPADRPAPAGSR